MNNTFLKLLVAVFVVLASIALFPMILGKDVGNEENSMDRSIADLSGLDKDSTETITIGKDDAAKVLSRKDGVWRIGNDEADATKIDALFSDFSDLKVKEVASRNEDNFGKFKVSEDTGIVLKIVSGGKEVSYIVGKDGPVAGQSYIRKSGMKNVYLVDGGNLSQALNRSAQDWKKKDSEDADGTGTKQD